MQTTLKQLISNVSNRLANRVITSSESSELNEGVAQIQALIGQTDGMLADMFFDEDSFKAIFSIESKEERKQAWRQILRDYVRAELTSL